MGRLRSADVNCKRQVYFVTIERKPDERLKALASDFIQKHHPVIDMHACDEVSNDGYHHTHVVWKCARQVRWVKLCKMLQKEFKFDKENGSEISVRFFVTNDGDGDQSYLQVKKYLTEPHVHKEIDEEGISFAASNAMRLADMLKNKHSKVRRIYEPNHLHYWQAYYDCYLRGEDWYTGPYTIGMTNQELGNYTEETATKMVHRCSLKVDTTDTWALF